MVEGPKGNRQKINSVVSLKAGDYCLTQQNVAVEKITAKKAKEIIEILKAYGG